MFPNLSYSQCTRLPAKQRGAALAVAVFIIVIMSLIGVAMVRILGNSSQAIVGEVYGSRAQLAARAGAELFLTELFPHDAPAAQGLCPVRTASPPPEVRPEQLFGIDGLKNCSTTIFCDRAELNSPYQGVHFRIIAQGECAAGDMTYSKVLMLEAGDGIL